MTISPNLPSHNIQSDDVLYLYCQICYRSMIPHNRDNISNYSINESQKWTVEKTRHVANQIENQTIKLDSECDTATSSFKYRATH